MQGMGRHSLEEVRERAKKDLDACAALLQSSGAYLSGETPCQADCFLFALMHLVRARSSSIHHTIAAYTCMCLWWLRMCFMHAPRSSVRSACVRMCGALLQARAAGRGTRHLTAASGLPPLPCWVRCSCESEQRHSHREVHQTSGRRRGRASGARRCTHHCTAVRCTCLKTRAAST